VVEFDGLGFVLSGDKQVHSDQVKGVMCDVCQTLVFAFRDVCTKKILIKNVTLG
jgi:hypothetical protein